MERIGIRVRVGGGGVVQGGEVEIGCDEEERRVDGAEVEEGVRDGLSLVDYAAAGAALGDGARGGGGGASPLSARAVRATHLPHRMRLGWRGAVACGQVINCSRSETVGGYGIGFGGLIVESSGPKK